MTGSPKKTLWTAFDTVVGAARNFFCCVGILSILALIGYWRN